jgi:uncharacterized protein DUF3500
MNHKTLAALGLASMLLAQGAAAASCDANGGGKIEPVLAAVAALQSALTPAQRALFDRPLTHETAIQWSNLPVALVPRAGVRLGDLSESQAVTAHKLFEAALSACGVKLLDEIRRADDYLLPLDEHKIGWDGGNYYLSVLGEASRSTPWILQLGGHHIAYNLTFNGPQAGATPLFFGTEPIRFEHAGATYEPLRMQSTAMSAVARAIQEHKDAKLAGTFTDVVKGVVMIPVPGGFPKGGTDTGFPQNYPTGSADRGVAYTSLTKAQQKLVLAALRSYASLPGAAISAPLVAAYESAAALRETYVGYSGAVDLSAKGSYVRIDGPRIWMEFVVQPAVADPKTLHYHALWRDKLSDYGGEVH